MKNSMESGGSQLQVRKKAIDYITNGESRWVPGAKIWNRQNNAFHRGTQYKILAKIVLWWNLLNSPLTLDISQ